MRRTTAASSSSRTQGLAADDAETFVEQLLDEAVAWHDLPDVQPRSDAHLG
jgi:hypothetical protein